MTTDKGQSAVPFIVPEAAPVGTRVRLARVAANLTPEQIAAALGISARVYYRRERGEQPFRRGELMLIAQLCAQDPALFGVVL